MTAPAEHPNAKGGRGRKVERTPEEQRQRNRERTRAYRARLYEQGFHFVRGVKVSRPYRIRRPSDPLPEHGTEQRYHLHAPPGPCRCDACRKANADAARIRVRAIRARRKESAGGGGQP